MEFVVDITERKHHEQTLEKEADLDAFRVALTDAIRPLIDPEDVQHEAARVLGEQLDADRVHYAEVADDEDTVWVHDEYRPSDVPSTIGEHRLSDFGEDASETFQADETLVIEDTQTISGLGEEGRATYEALQTRAHVNVPLVKSPAPRSDAEVLSGNTTSGFGRFLE